MGTVVHADFGPGGAEAPISKKRLATILGRSTRWVELRTREGLPSTMRHGRRWYELSQAQAWLDERGVKQGNGRTYVPPPKAPSGQDFAELRKVADGLAERVAALESRFDPTPAA